MKTARIASISLMSVCVVLIAAALALSVAHAQTTAQVTSTLSPGASGSQVSALQTFLAADASVYPEGLVTGYYGSLTVAGVERYQCKNGVVCQGSVATTGYGRVGPATLAKIMIQEGLTPGGVSLPGTGLPSTADPNAPVLGAPSVSTSSTSAVIHWNTNELAHSTVLYSTSIPALSSESFAAMAQANDSTFDASSDVTLSNLAPNTIYYYVIESVDASGNIQYGINHSFRTNS